jgi:sugar O-acyltransferase (sialic acid O-acetyltransferase NeuD family)
MKLLIYGTGMIAEVADYYFTHDSDYDVIGFINHSDFITSDTFAGKPIYDIEQARLKFPPESVHVFVAVGYSGGNFVRQARYIEFLNYGYRLASYISSKASLFIPQKEIGNNCFLLENNVIQPFVSIGSNVILCSGNHIGHHSRIEDHVFISSHVVISGSCIVETNCFLGVNSTLHDNIQIGSNSVIGAGAVVKRSIGPHSLVRPSISNVTSITVRKND